MTIRMFAKLVTVFSMSLLLFSGCGGETKDNGEVPDPDQPGSLTPDLY